MSTYVDFRRKKMFGEWEGTVPQAMVTAARKVFADTCDRLEALGPNPDRAAARSILQQCIVTFNRLNEENSPWIMSLEREDICAHFDELAQLAGFDDEPDLADEWRDW